MTDERKPFDLDAARNLRDNVQGGVIARWQLRDHQARDHDIRRLVRRRELTAIHPGVYVNHTGTPTWGQRAWAAVLACWPAALTADSALPRPAPDKPIQVMVALHRTVRAPSRVEVRRTSRFDDFVDWLAYPPRQDLVEAAVDAAVDRDNLEDAYTLLAQLLQAKAVTAKALISGVRRRPRLRGKALLLGLLEDLEAGACSVLEREYLRRVERAHGLPRGERQVPDDAGGRSVIRDVVYRAFGLIVEIDGRAFHDNAAARVADHERDLDAAVDRDALTVRITHGQILGGACHTADRIGRLLQQRGWPGVVRRCPNCA